MHENNTAPARSLEDRLDSDAEAWIPNPGDKVVGLVLDIDTRTTEFGTYPIVVLLTDSGDEFAVHAFHTVLKNEFAKRQPRVGERLGIRYLGKQPKGYEGYRLAWEHVVAPDWNRIGVEAAADAVLEGVDIESTPSDDEPNAVETDDVPF